MLDNLFKEKKSTLTASLLSNLGKGKKSKLAKTMSTTTPKEVPKETPKEKTTKFADIAMASVPKTPAYDFTKTFVPPSRDADDILGKH